MSREKPIIERLPPGAIGSVLDDVSALRVSVFRDWPYLYEGDADYEREYLGEFASAKDAVVVVAREAETNAIVGAATAAPLMSHTSEFAPLFSANGFDPATIFYCGESVLLPSYRGLGIGHAFFDEREAAAREMRTDAQHPFTHTAFCGVMRSADDPRAPEFYRALDPFWRKRGYEPVPEMVGSYAWREVGSPDETDHSMQFWVRALDTR
ncbi:MAG: GNAT family N-acetyltransferase [Pseudomonadota bacterium]